MPMKIILIIIFPLLIFTQEFLKINSPFLINTYSFMNDNGEIERIRLGRGFTRTNFDVEFTNIKYDSINSILKLSGNILQKKDSTLVVSLHIGTLNFEKTNKIKIPNRMNIKRTFKLGRGKFHLQFKIETNNYLHFSNFYNISEKLISPGGTSKYCSLDKIKPSN